MFVRFFLTFSKFNQVKERKIIFLVFTGGSGAAAVAVAVDGVPGAGDRGGGTCRHLGGSGRGVPHFY